MADFHISPAAVPANPTPCEWRIAVASVRSAFAVLDAQEGSIDREGVQRLKVFAEAERTLFRIPAPDLSGLLFKLELFEHSILPDNELVQHILGDARRLIGTVDLLPFDPAAWLEQWSTAGGAVMAREDQLFLGFGCPPAGMADEIRRIELQRQLIDHDGVAALLTHLRRPFQSEVQS
jgi:hypothetical protein